jgi:hypothetical protein
MRSLRFPGLVFAAASLAALAAGGCQSLSPVPRFWAATSKPNPLVTGEPAVPPPRDIPAGTRALGVMLYAVLGFPRDLVDLIWAGIPNVMHNHVGRHSPETSVVFDGVFILYDYGTLAFVWEPLLCWTLTLDGFDTGMHERAKCYESSYYKLGRQFDHRQYVHKYWPNLRSYAFYVYRETEEPQPASTSVPAKEGPSAGPVKR